MIKPILQLYPMIPAADEAERAALRPAGRNAERYQDVVRGMNELVKAAEEIGFWGVSAIEHHFHSEGYEVGPNPGLLNAHWAAITDTINIGQRAGPLNSFGRCNLRRGRRSRQYDMCGGRVVSA